MEGSLEYNEYYDQIEQRVRQNWSPPENLDPGEADFVTVVSLSILPDGKIEKSWVEKSSGNRFFDESVMRAILKSNPLPPPPIEFTSSTLEVGLRFHSNPDYATNTTH
jgi:TonB family protein